MQHFAETTVISCCRIVAIMKYYVFENGCVCVCVDIKMFYVKVGVCMLTQKCFMYWWNFLMLVALARIEWREIWTFHVLSSLSWQRSIIKNLIPYSYIIKWDILFSCLLVLWREVVPFIGKVLLRDCSWIAWPEALYWNTCFFHLDSFICAITYSIDFFVLS